MEAEGQLGTKLVLEGGVLEIFSHGRSAARLQAGADAAIRRIPRGDGLAISIRLQDGSKLLAFSAEQTPAAEALLAAFESSGPA
ncbi:MAG: hypothetical protein WD844_16085 [Thermoleophilaceae bacterium]